MFRFESFYRQKEREENFVNGYYRLYDVIKLKEIFNPRVLYIFMQLLGREYFKSLCISFFDRIEKKISRSFRKSRIHPIYEILFFERKLKLHPIYQTFHAATIFQRVHNIT